MLRSVPSVNGTQHRYQFASPLRRIRAGRRPCEDSANPNGSVEGLCRAGSRRVRTALGRIWPGRGSFGRSGEKRRPQRAYAGGSPDGEEVGIGVPERSRLRPRLAAEGGFTRAGATIVWADRSRRRTVGIWSTSTLFTRGHSGLDLRPGSLISSEDLLENWASFPPPRALPIRPTGHDAPSKTVNRAQSTQERSLVRQSQGALWRASYSAQMN